MKTRKQAVDLTDLAIGLVILGIVVTIGASVLLVTRDSRLSELDVETTGNETVDFSSLSSNTLSNTWVKGINTVTNATNGVVINSGNYSLSVSDLDGTGTITNLTSTFPSSWNVTYETYDTTRADWALADDAAVGVGEFGNWFTIIVIVGIAGLVLALIFMAFGGRTGEGGVTY